MLGLVWTFGATGAWTLGEEVCGADDEEEEEDDEEEVNGRFAVGAGFGLLLPPPLLGDELVTPGPELEPDVSGVGVELVTPGPGASPEVWAELRPGKIALATASKTNNSAALRRIFRLLLLDCVFVS